MIRRWSLGLMLLTAGPVLGQPAPFEQQTFRNIAYYEGPDADPVRHQLDVHVPKGLKDFPVLFFLHGGAWVEGDKNLFGIQTMLARTFNRHGIGVVCPNYRLSPKAKHPDHIHDVARAFAWTHSHIGKYGGSSDEIFVSGHSAGGHLCALLATDESYLKGEGLSLKAVRGALPISGLFIIPNDRLFQIPFGKDPEVHIQASPLEHVKKGLPDFLVMFADYDLPGCGRPGADAFCRALTSKGCVGELCEFPHRNHATILWNAINDADPVMQSMLSFIEARVALDRLGQNAPQAVDAFGDYLARYVACVAGRK
jgi:arylformamidase